MNTAKKRIIIANNEMHIGGIQKSLLNLLEEIKDRYDVTLFLASASGKLNSCIPDSVHVIYGNFFTRILGLTQSEAKEKGFFCMLLRSFFVIISRIFGAGAAFGFLSHLQRIDGEYDAAVSYMQNSGKRIFYGGINEIVLNAVHADLKIAFIHCDFKNYEGNNPYNRKLCRRFDRIACVSEGVRTRFLEVMSDMSEKTYCVHNCYDFRLMAEMSEKESVPYTDSKINIFTAARLSREKGILRMIPIFAEIREKCPDFIWRIAGSGADFSTAYEMIKQYALSDSIVLIGETENPYPYFKTADIVLVPSYHEAAPMVFGEAEFFGTPVFTTETTSAHELVGDKGIGWVCENSDKQIAKRLSEVLNDREHIKHYESKMNNSRAAAEFDALVSRNGI
ncbi:MAG: glycosyltransferase [Eubacteriales bacterium]